MARLILSAAPCSVRKAPSRKGWLVEGEVAVIAGQVVDERFCILRPTKVLAEAYAAAQDRRNAEAIAELEAETAAEKARVAKCRAAMLAVRVEKAACQFVFAF